MDNVDIDKMGGKTYSSVVAQWKRHPSSWALVILGLPLFFLIIMMHDPSVGKENLAIYTLVFALVIYIILFAILFFKKNVLYNAFDEIISEIEHRAHYFEEKLENVNLEFTDPYQEQLEKVCPQLRNISDDLRKDVYSYELLVHMLNEHCGLHQKVADKTNLALAKFYYKERYFTKALNKINAIRTTEDEKKSNEIYAKNIHFYKGLILRKLGRDEDSIKEFEMTRNEDRFPGCFFICTKTLGSDQLTDEVLAKFIENAEKCLFNKKVKCLNSIAVASFKRAKLFQDNQDERKASLKKALDTAQEIINKFESYVGYYNKACYLCYMAKIEKQENKENIISEILATLQKAFNKKPVLIRYCKDDEDLKWIRENAPKNYYELVGSAYEKIGIF